MIGERDAAATDAAELEALSRKAAQQRAELASTVRALAGMVSGGRLRAYALEAVRLGTGAAWGAARREFRARTPGHLPHRGPARAAATVTVGLAVVCVAAVALHWRTRHTPPAGRPRAQAR